MFVRQRPWSQFAFSRTSSHLPFPLITHVSHLNRIRLQLLKPSPAIALNVTVFAALSGRSLGRQITTSGPYADNTSGAVTPQINVSPGKYLVVASTYDPGISSDFQLQVYSKASDVKLQKIDWLYTILVFFHLPAHKAYMYKHVYI